MLPDGQAGRARPGSPGRRWLAAAVVCGACMAGATREAVAEDPPNPTAEATHAMPPTDLVLEVPARTGGSPYYLVLALPPSVWRFPDCDVASLAVAPEGAAVGLCYQPNPLRAGFESYAFLMIEDATPPEDPQAFSDRKAGALMEDLRQRGWSITVPVGKMSALRKVRLLSHRVPLFGGEFAANDNHYITEGTGKTSVNYYAYFVLRVDDVAISLLVENADKASVFVDGLRLTAKDPRTARSATLKLMASAGEGTRGDNRSTHVVLQAPDDLVLVVPSPLSAGAAPASGDRVAARWRSTATRLPSAEVLRLEGDPSVRLDLDQETAVWLAGLDPRYRTVGSTTTQRIRGLDLRRCVLVERTADRESAPDSEPLPVRACALFLLNGVRWCLDWSEAPPSASDVGAASERAAAALDRVLSSLDAWETDVFRMPSTARPKEPEGAR